MSKNTNTRPANQQQAETGARPGLEDALRADPREDGEDERLVRRADGGRGDRGATEDAAREEDGLMSAADYEELVRNEFEQTALPQPPAIPGWHLCWLTTTSQYDSIAKRQRIGYKPVQRSEMPGFDPSNGADLTKFEGFVTCNEMVLHKIPERYYQQMMTYFHHKRPKEDEAGTLKKVATGLEAEGDAIGKDLEATLGDGYLDMEERIKRKAPRFAS